MLLIFVDTKSLFGNTGSSTFGSPFGQTQTTSGPFGAKQPEQTSGGFGAFSKPAAGTSQRLEKSNFIRKYRRICCKLSCCFDSFGIYEVAGQMIPKMLQIKKL